MKKQVKIFMHLALTLALSVLICNATYANNEVVELVEIEETEIVEETYFEISSDNIEIKTKNVSRDIEKCFEISKLNNGIDRLYHNVFELVLPNESPSKIELHFSNRLYQLYCSLIVYN